MDIAGDKPRSVLQGRRFIAAGLTAIAIAILALLVARFAPGVATDPGVERNRKQPGSPAPAEPSQGAPRDLAEKSAANSFSNAGVESSAPFEERYAIRQLLSDFPRLAALAQSGDLVAAKVLWRALERCSQGPRNQAELDAKLRTILSDRYTVPEFVSGGRSEMAENVKRHFSRCGELLPDQINSKRKWVAQLAEAGDMEARIEFPFAAQPGDIELSDFAERRNAFVEKAKEYLNAEIASGNASALSAMAHAYMPPIIAGQTTPFTVDDEQAYKYYFAYALSENAPAGVVTIIARLENSLTPQQIQHAREDGRRIFDECCRR